MMSQTFPRSLLLCALTISALLAQDAPTCVYKTVPLTIDGRLDEEAWQKAVTIPIQYIMGKKGVVSEDPVGHAKVCWDDYYLYIGYETHDKNIVAIGSGAVEGDEWNKRPGAKIWDSANPKVDVVEFFISFNEDPEHFWEIHHNAANQFNDVFIVSPRKESSFNKSLPYDICFLQEAYIHDDGPYKLATATHLKPRINEKDRRPVRSSINNPEDVDGGYTAEIRLPFGSIGGVVPLLYRGVPKCRMDGALMRMQHVIQDGDRQHRYHHGSKDFAGGWFHKSFEHWVQLKLVAQTGPEKDG